MKMKNRIITLTGAIVLSLSTYAVDVKLDHTWYLAGEAMKVRVTADDAAIAYAELCDTHGLAAGVVIRLQGNEGVGILELPSNLHSGYYLLSAYTRNDVHHSHQLVAVVNPLRRSVDDDIEWVESNSQLNNSEFTINNSALGPQGRLPEQEFIINNPQLDELGEVYSPLALCRGVGNEAPELDSHLLFARVKNHHEGHAFKDSDICPSLSIVGKQIHYFEGEMVDDSTAVFRTFDVHGRQPLVLSATTSKGVSLPIELLSPFSIYRPKQLPHLVFRYNRSEVEARSLDMQRHQLKLNAEKQAETEPLPYDEKVIGTRPDLSYNLDEYRQFLTIREVLLEYVLCVKNTTINGVPRLIVRKEQEVFNSSLPTLVLIDGMPVSDIEPLLNYDARRMHYINIYGGQFTFGKGVYNGILSFVTRSGRLTNYPTEPLMQYLLYDFPE